MNRSTSARRSGTLCNIRARPWLALILVALLLAACQARDATPTPRPAIRPIATLFPTLAAAPTPAPDADTGWQPGGSGVAVRHLRAAEDSGGPPIALVLVRLDPAAVRLRVGYSPDQPRTIQRWFADERPLLAINGGYFAASYQSTALVVSDGVASGASYEGFGGMLAVSGDGAISLRALREQPYDPGEPISQALQSAPMLVMPGGAPATIQDDGQRARRSAVGIDRAGRLLLIVSPTAGFTLRGFAVWLSRSDLDLDRALNLDGGSSTGLYLKSGALDERIDSLGPLPLTLLVDPR